MLQLLTLRYTGTYMYMYLYMEVSIVTDAIELKIMQKKVGVFEVGERVTIICLQKKSLDKFDTSQCSTFELRQIFPNGTLITIPPSFIQKFVYNVHNIDFFICLTLVGSEQ